MREEHTPAGDPVCWLERVCDECGALVERGDTCERCGAPLTEESGDAREP